jgi:hypothetical protein
MMSTIRVSFKDDESRAKARWLILTSKDKGFSKVVVNKPPRDLIVDLEALRLVHENGIKMYPPAANNRKPLYKDELDITKLLAGTRA